MSLLELLLALSGGLLLVGVMLQAVLAETRDNQQLGERLRQRAMAGRALALISADGARASRLTIGGTGGSMLLAPSQWRRLAQGSQRGRWRGRC